MRVKVSNKLIVENPTKDILAWCKKNLVLANPDREKKERMGLWVGDTPRYIWLYEIVGDDIYLPFGCLQRLYQIAPASTEWKVEIAPLRAVDYQSGINLYPYQEIAVNAAIRAKNGVLVMPCGAGKGLPIDAKICTPTGWKCNGDLQVGDAVVGSDGKATKVTGIFDRGKVDAYKITFSDGVETVCDKDHLWTIQKQSQRSESGNWFVENTENIYKHYQNMKCRSQYLYIPIVEPVNYYCWNKKDLTMNPWLLGFLLGDGCFQKSMITMSTNEDDLREKVVDIIGRDYGACEWLSYKSKYDYRFCGGYVFHDIKTLDLYCKHSYEKFIPAEYIYNSIEVRLAVLQGLFDADGHISNGTTFEYSTTSKQLADNVVEIVESLGGTAKVKTKTPTYTYNGEKRTGRTAYRIFFKLYKFKPFTSAKHANAYKERTNYTEAYRIIKKIEPCDPIISRCITVDAPNELYVTDHYVVTHNTQTALQIIAQIGGRALWLTHTQDLLNQSKARAESVFGAEGLYGTITAGKINIGRGITFATVQTMAKIDLQNYRDIWDIVICDECMPANTLIDTPTGQKELQDLRIDDIITSYNRNAGKTENKRIKHIFKNKAHNIVKVKLSDGKEIVCTSNHPIFTKNGQWVNADRLVCDDYVLRLVRQGNRNGYDAKNHKKQNAEKGLLLLLKRMLRKGRSQEGCLDGGTQEKSIRENERNKYLVSRSVCGENENEKSDEKCRSAKSCIGEIERDRTQTKGKGWKRNGIICTTKNDDGCYYCDTDRCNDNIGISCANKNGKEKQLSDLLQDRCCADRTDDRNRDRRKFTLFNKKARARQEKRTVFEWVRVESVEIQKQTSDGTFGGLCEDGYVYNIEVEDNNNYFANDILVHNCQHAAGSPTKVTQFYKVINSLSARYKIGLTATPFRADGLERAMFALLGGTIHEVKRDEVKDTTCPIEIITFETGYKPDIMSITGGDGMLIYSALVDDLTNDPARFAYVLNALCNIADGDGVLVLGSRIAYLQKMCKKYIEKTGKKAVCLSGAGNSKKAKQMRKQAIAALDAGNLDCVFASYKLAAEGLDCPNLRYVFLATPEKDKTIITQSAGRVGRKAAGKTRGYVVDFIDDYPMYRAWAQKRRGIYAKL